VLLCCVIINQVIVIKKAIKHICCLFASQAISYVRQMLLDSASCDVTPWLLLLVQVFYLVFVYGILRPDESYLNSYRYLSGKDSWISKMLNVCGSRYLLLLLLVESEMFLHSIIFVLLLLLTLLCLFLKLIW